MYVHLYRRICNIFGQSWSPRLSHIWNYVSPRDLSTWLILCLFEIFLKDKIHRSFLKVGNFHSSLGKTEKYSARLNKAWGMSPWSLLLLKHLAFHPFESRILAGRQTPQLEDCCSGTKWFLARSLADLPKFAKHKTGGSNLFPFGSCDDVG